MSFTAIRLLSPAVTRSRQHSMAGRDQFILKDIPEAIFSKFNEQILPRLTECPNPYIRLPHDTIPGERILVYRHLKDDFLDLVQRGIPVSARKKILKSSLLGIAALHDRDIVHLDIKPDNIMVDSSSSSTDEISIDRVQLIDLENAAYLPPRRCIKGMLAGNDNWRSPEAHLKAELNKPTDLFSFGVVDASSFGPDADFEKHQAQGALPELIRLQRQVSYFGDVEGLGGLVRHVADDELSCQALQMLWDDRLDENIPYRPFTEWSDARDATFQDLIGGLTNLDPGKRLTAWGALGHEWFVGV
ncbi:kinase-like protein [Aspergillus steynii IBT 23096]|uniref:Kinase-like protein n=1 Tax=Aspergillus steynii IBT 23096 TaxID=1392250 RepID=A0A2I2G2Q3_9EURO|nr:kinase-like protein [Aspergillus steynii IBT 23096]PLB47152.1 kinase-like protein [Aspergillus steynii IBT 23096]